MSTEHPSPSVSASAGPPRPAPDIEGTVLKEVYVVGTHIASGGMGSVFRAHHAESGQPLAVKTLDLSADDPLFRRRFFNEATMAAQLEHPQSVKVIDFGVEGSLCFMVMELLEGQSLPRHLREHGPMSPTHALRVAHDLCGVLEVAHGKDFIHRDIKPSNLFITDIDEDGPVVKMLDFGLATRTNRDTRLTVPGTLLGSPRYMSPEQLHGGTVGNATDIYNIGLVLFRLLTGTDAYRGQEQSKVLIAQATQPTPRLEEVNPNLPHIDALQWLIDTCTRKVAGERFNDVVDLRQAILHVADVAKGRRDSADFDTLRQLVPHLDTEAAVPQGVGTPSAPPSLRSPWFVAVAGVALLLVGTTFGLSIGVAVYLLLG